MLVIFLLLRKVLLGPQPIPRIDSIPTTTRHAFTHRLRTIDWPGQILFLLGLAFLVLSLTWAGATHPWSSPAVLVPLCAGVVLLAAWVCWEYMMREDGILGRRWPWRTPMVEWGVLSDRNIGLTVYTSFATGAAVFAVGFFPKKGSTTAANRRTNSGSGIDILLLQHLLCLRGGKQGKSGYRIPTEH